jgi:hypothetical protein
MVKQIQVGNEIIEFPDDMDDSQIEAALSSEFGAAPQPTAQPEEPSITQRAGRAVSGAARGAVSGLERFGLGAFQTAADLGVEFSGAKRVLGMIRPDLAQEIESFTPEDISEALGRRVAEKKRAAEKEGTAFKVTEAIGQTLPILGVGGVSLPAIGATGAAASAISPLEEGGLQNRGIEAIKGGAISLATAGALKTFGSGLEKLGKAGKGLVNKFDERLFAGEVDKPLTSAMLKSRASKAFKEAEEKGAVLKESVSDKFLKAAEKELTEESRIGKKLLADSTTSKTLTKLKDSITGERFDLPGIQSTDRFLASKILDETTIRGTLTDEGRRLLKVQNKLRDLVNKAKAEDIQGGKAGLEALKKGNKLWSKSLKLGEIEAIIEKAKSRFVDNPSQSIRAGFRALATNPKRLKGFSKEEVKLIKEAAKTGIVTDALKTLGGRLIPIGAVVAGKGPAQVAGAQVAAVSSRELAKLAQAKKAQKVIEEISRSAVGGARVLQSRPKRIADILTKGTALTTTNF